MGCNLMDKICLGKAVKLHGFRGGLKMNAKYDSDFDTSKYILLFLESVRTLSLNNKDLFCCIFSSKTTTHGT